MRIQFSVSLLLILNKTKRDFLRYTPSCYNTGCDVWLFLLSVYQNKSIAVKGGAISAIFMEMFLVKSKVSVFAQLEILCQLAHDVKKLFSVRGKLIVFSDLSSNLSDIRTTGRLEWEKSTSNLVVIYRTDSVTEYKHNKENAQKELQT